MMEWLCQPLVAIRVIIMVFQCIGSYFYNWPSKTLPCIRRFSMSLFLWSLFTKILLISFTVQDIVQRRLLFHTVGHILDYVSVIVSVSVFTFTSVLMAVKSKSLARVMGGLNGLLADFSYSGEILKQPFWTKYNLGILLPITSTSFVVLSVLYVMVWHPISLSIVYSLLKFFCFIVKAVGVLLFCILNKLILKVLWLHLRASSLQCLENLPHDLKNAPENQESSTLARLFQFESEVRKVEIIRDDAVTYFGSVVSSLFLSITVLLITRITYVIYNSEGQLYFIGALSLVFNSIVIFYFLCHMGQEFTDEMDKTSGLLRDLSIKSNDVDTKAQISRLILQLDNLKTINIFGWYPLNHGTLVSIASFVATYVVVLLQVSQQDLQTSSNN